MNKEIGKIIDDFEINKNNYTVWIIANVADTVQSEESFIKHSNFSEFFTKAEFSSIVSAISDIFGYVRIFYSEIEFITYVLANKDQIDNLHTVIYNFSRDGINEGKKSLIPAFCDLFQLKYIGSNPFVVSLLRNKFVFTKFLGNMGIPVPKTMLYEFNCHNDISCFIKKPIIAKNIFESASIGMDTTNIICYDTRDDYYIKLNELCNNLNIQQLLIQDYIDGIECETFVINLQGNYYAFQPVALEINGSNILTSKISDSNNYTFVDLAKYMNNNVCNNIMQVTKKAAKLLNIKNYARFDYRVTSNGEFYLIDIAGSPYLTRHSSIAYLFTNILGINYNKIFSLLAALTNLNQLNDVNCKSDNKRPLEK